MKQSVEDFITEDLAGSINKLSAVIDIEELKQAVKLAKELRENIADIEDSVTLELPCTDIEIKKSKQGQLVQNLHNALSMIQNQILDNYQPLESVFDTLKLQKVANVTVNLQSNLAAAVSNVTFITHGVDRTSPSGPVLSIQEERILEKQQPVLFAANDKQETVLKETFTELDLSDLSSSHNIIAKETATSQEVKSDKQSFEHMKIREVKPIELQNMAESVILNKVEELKVCTLKQGIKCFICDELIEIMTNLSSIINLNQLNQSINLAKELYASITAVESNTFVSTDSIELDSRKEKQVLLVKQLQAALLIVQEEIFNNYQKLEDICESSKLQEVANITINLQAQLTDSIVDLAEVKEKSFDSVSTVVPSASIEAAATLQITQPVDLGETSITDKNQNMEKIKNILIIESEQNAIGVSREVIIQDEQETMQETIDEQTEKGQTSILESEVGEKALVTSTQAVIKDVNTTQEVKSEILQAITDNLGIEFVQPFETAELYLAKDAFGMYFFLYYNFIVVQMHYLA